ncbi:MAG: hypothetical protein P8I93_00150 [Crocinitomicaceae bacterium]|nr:hypothetical protein [Crocinitomicaceae bacterium]
MSNKKQLLIICSHFHPMKHIASYRMNAFAKYLDPSKIEVTVLTISETENRKEKVFNNTWVYYLPYNPIFRLRKQKQTMPKWKHWLFSLNNKMMRFFSKSDYPGWQKNALKQALKLEEKNKIDFILSSFSPIDSHLIAFEFKKRTTDNKWIADMRDEMSLNQMLGKKERKYYKKVEDYIFPEVDFISAVSAPILDGFKNPINKNIQYIEIRNGFDHQEKLIKKRNQIFTFVYAGTFYGKRKPDTFFSALKELSDSGQLKIPWKLLFIGTPKNFSIPKQFGKNISFVESMENIEVIKVLAQSDCNLLIHPPSKAKGVFTGKLFDYLSVQQPILALVDVEDVAADLINKCNAGNSVDFYDINSIKEELLNIFDCWQNNIENQYNEVLISSLHRKKEVLKLQKIILNEN